MNDVDITPPDYTKSDENCRLRGQDRECFNALNYLRPHTCNGYCVAKLDRWLREEHPEMDEGTIKSTVAKLTQHHTE